MSPPVFHLRSSFSHHFSNTSNNNTSCYDLTPHYCFHRFCVDALPLIPLCIIAGLIGWICGIAIRKKVKSATSWVYSTAFCMFGTMMPTAMVLHCFLTPNLPKHMNVGLTILYFIVAIVDMGLTSSVSMTFAWGGIGDIRLADPSGKGFKIGYWTSIACIFVGYLFVFITNSWMIGMTVLYTGIIVVAGAVFGVTQLILLVKTKQLTGKTIVSYSISIVSSALGVASYTVLCAFFYNFFAALFGAKVALWFGGQTWWYVFSDVSMWTLFLYILAASQASIRYQRLDKRMAEELAAIEQEERLQAQQAAAQVQAPATATYPSPQYAPSAYANYWNHAVQQHQTYYQQQPAMYPIYHHQQQHMAQPSSLYPSVQQQ